MKTYEEFRKDWLGEQDWPVEDFEIELCEYFCECDYKRYVGDWKETL